MTNFHLEVVASSYFTEPVAVTQLSVINLFYKQHFSLLLFYQVQWLVYFSTEPTVPAIWFSLIHTASD